MAIYKTLSLIHFLITDMSQIISNEDRQNEENNKTSTPKNANGNLSKNDGRQSMLKDLDGDKLHVVALFLLYTLQGIPMGLKDSIPLLLTKRNVPYKDQAAYSISNYPFSMKILWAPLVDSVYVTRFGRRKSWLVPVQYLIGKQTSGSCFLTSVQVPYECTGICTH